MDQALALFRSRLGDRYVLERELGRGGMATVYLARDLKHARHVAIKVLHPELASSLGGERFLREIRTTARLNHPHILPMHDSGEAGGWLYFVMPQVEGESLRDRLRREGALTVAEATRITLQMADALACAHAQGVVHRDVKPENILLRGNHAWIADFGLARALSSAANDRLTRTGVAIGSPLYMSPEQASGEPGDECSDIYSLGCVLFEMLAGRAPYHGRDVQALLTRHLTAPVPSVRRYRPELPEALDAVVASALAKRPEDRIGSAQDMSRALEPFAGAARASMHAPRWNRDAWRPRARVLAATMTAAVTLLLGLAGLAEWRGGSIGSMIAPAALDTLRYVVVPFRYEGRVPADLREDLRLHDAFARWRGIRVVDQYQISDALERRPQARLSSAEARELARSLGAARMVWGEVSRLDGGIRVRASLYDASARDSALGHASVRFAVGDLAVADSIFALLADSLLFPRVGSAGYADVSAASTTSYAARQAYLRGHDELAAWDFAGAEREFGAAIREDPGYAQAYLWLAQVQNWSGREAAAWRPFAEQAEAAQERLAPREQRLARGLVHLGRGEFAQACRLYDGLARADLRDFPGWYGAGECRRGDRAVVPDRTSPSGWRFRSSPHRAIAAYAHAFEILPTVHRGFRGTAYERVRELLVVSSTALLVGHALSPDDTLRFAAYPGWQGDTLVYVPYPLQEVMEARPHTVPATLGAAVENQRLAFHRIATSWSRSLPGNPNALEALALSLEMLGDPAALDTLRRARSLSTGADRLRLAIADVWLQVKLSLPDDVHGLARARLLADSLLAMRDSVSPAQARRLASIAMLTGQATLAAELAQHAASEQSPGFVVPVAIARPAGALLVYSALGAPRGRIAALERQVESGIRLGLPGDQHAFARNILLARAAALALPVYRFPSAVDGELVSTPVLQAAAALQRGDTASVRRILDRVAEARRPFPPADLKIEVVFPEAWLLTQLGDERAAVQWLEPSLQALQWGAPRELHDIARAGALVRAMSLRAELAVRRGDDAAAHRWATPVVVLWAGADAALQPTVTRMRRIAAVRT